MAINGHSTTAYKRQQQRIHRPHEKYHGFMNVSWIFLCAHISENM